MAYPRSGGNRRRGGALLEGALCINVFLLIVFGAIEFSRVVYAYNVVAYAARDASRYASVRGSSSPSPATAAAISAFVSSQAVMLPSGSLTVTTTWSPSNAPGSKVTVRVSCAMNRLLATYILPAMPTIASTSTMTILQ